MESEKLREALLDLDRAREQEKRLRVESEALLEGLRIITSSSSTQDALVRLMEVLKNIIGFDDAFVLFEQEDSWLSVVAATDAGFKSTTWEVGKMLARVFAGKPVMLFDIGKTPEWLQQSDDIRSRVVSALHAPFGTVKAKAIFVCVSRQRAFFKKSHLQLLQRFSPLASQTLQNLENTEKLRHAMEQTRQMAAQADAANRAKGAFLANMSHEIRTPMNGIVGMTNILMGTELTDEQREFLQIVEHSADNLLSIINDILDFSKIEAGMLEFETIDFDLRSTVEDTAQLLAIRAHQKNLELVQFVDPKIPVLLKGDPGRLRQVIINLANNAIKFTQKGEVSIRVNLQKDLGAEVELRIEVRDTGIGIPEDRRHRLFRAFSQVDASTTRQYGGTGLGLAICKQLVILMGGDIGVESMEGLGATFWFSVVLSKQPRIVSNIQPKSISITDKRILIVDDNRTNRKVLGAYLADWGCRHKLASDAREGLQMLREAVAENDPFDMAIVDYMMPIMDGEELGKIIKADPQLTRTIMVMLTSCPMRGDAARMKSIGFHGYMQKPVKQDVLYRCLADIYRKTTGDPDDKAPDHIVTRHSIRENRNRSAKILLAEDNIVNQKVALAILKKIGFSADVAENGKLALEMLQAKHYDLVLMDVQMPVMDGFQATAHIRNSVDNGLNPDIPVIAMTANAMKGDREKCLQAGMDDYASKPIRAKELLAKLEKWLPN